MLARTFLLLTLLVLSPFALADDPVRYGVAEKPWDASLGSQRARVQVPREASAAHVVIPWRRPDADAARKAIIVIDASTGQRIRNITRSRVDREIGDIVFGPIPSPGEYFVYYLPIVTQKEYGWYSHDYLPQEEAPKAAWVEANRKDDAIAEAKVVAFEARTEFDRLDPMHVFATASEKAALLAKLGHAPFAVFPEDRKSPIKTGSDLPLRWLQASRTRTFAGEALRNEFYAFQLGLLAGKKPLEAIAVQFQDLVSSRGDIIPAAAFRCFNLAGVSPDGVPFTKTLNVPAATIQPLWIGVDVPTNATPGIYQGKLTVRAKDSEPVVVELSLSVISEVLADRGDSQPWRYSRLRWLDSTLGIDDEVIAPYTPVEVRGNAVRCLGRELRIDATGLPAQIQASDQPLLSRPIDFVIERAGGTTGFNVAGVKMLKQTPGSVTWESQLNNAEVALTCRATMEFDGHVNYDMTLRTKNALDLKDVRLEIPLRESAAPYFMGAGRPGGARPKDTYTWNWTGPFDSFWIGDAAAGLHCELRGGAYHGPLLNLYHPAPPPTWGNEGKGGVTVGPGRPGEALVRAFTGPRHLDANQELHFQFALLITPVKPLDTATHFRERYFHSGGEPNPTPEALAAGVNVVNLHHANRYNPYINYPFIAVDEMRSFIDKWHAQNMKVKIYYTIRELSNYVTELMALRSLGNEVLADGGGGGFPWLREHLGDHYTPSWYSPLENGTVDASITTSGKSRWYNYYVEGLAWLVKNLKIDGLYLDDVSYDRSLLKRMRNVLARENPGCLIDLHSNTAFSIGPANQYAEFFPYVDRLWFGEGFDYDQGPDYWLTEISGIPFGLMGDMLNNGGNRYRGMLYGMTARMPWDSSKFKADPRPMWKFWNDFGIDRAKMIGYWTKTCPVKTDRPDVLATAYVKEGKTLIAIASWAKEPVTVKLTIDWNAIGLDQTKARLNAPAIQDFQETKSLSPSDPIPVTPAQGWLFVLSE